MNCVRKLYICTTYHHVFIATTKTLFQKEQGEVDFLLGDEINTSVTLMTKLLAYGVAHNCYHIDWQNIKLYQPKSRIKRVLFEHFKNRAIIERFLKLDISRYSEVYMFHDGTALGKYMQDKRIPYHLIEDGLNQFQNILNTPSRTFLPPKNKIKYHIKRWFRLGYMPCGQNRYCKSLEVNDAKNLMVHHPNLIEAPKDKLYQSISGEQKDLVARIFLKDDILVNPIEKTALVFTIPLFRDQYVHTMQDQLQIFEDIIKEQQADGFHVYLKPHPRDLADYQYLSSDITLLDRDVPVEAYQFYSQFHFNRAVAIHSSSIEVFMGAEEKICHPLSYLQKYKQMVEPWVLGE